ncbi:hypothetical protein JOF56_011605 [Kibdelosporangium banguiense]|uniref:Uncharacterized protein n=1 Tax=Kibdelosporangium banguiense TaxID=1365924 RepID=A0ABS4U4T9_9PSEU|nr:hypothetical protein [Kibdelosporangium banguiense]MBP2331220.1 hypothetical protein [Kibdelosporangium banguiense]
MDRGFHTGQQVCREVEHAISENRQVRSGPGEHAVELRLHAYEPLFDLISDAGQVRDQRLRRTPDTSRNILGHVRIRGLDIRALRDGHDPDTGQRGRRQRQPRGHARARQNASSGKATQDFQQGRSGAAYRDRLGQLVAGVLGLPLRCRSGAFETGVITRDQGTDLTGLQGHKAYARVRVSLPGDAELPVEILDAGLLT